MMAYLLFNPWVERWTWTAFRWLVKVAPLAALKGMMRSLTTLDPNDTPVAELSTERARNVVGLLAAEMKDPTRLRAEGLADSEPLVPNDSAVNRAKNRRVAIILRSGS